MGTVGNCHLTLALSWLQLAQDELRCNALAELATHVGKRDAFHQLRTVEQLG